MRCFPGRGNADFDPDLSLPEGDEKPRHGAGNF